MGSWPFGIHRKGVCNTSGNLQRNFFYFTFFPFLGMLLEGLRFEWWQLVLPCSWARCLALLAAIHVSVFCSVLAPNGNFLRACSD